MCYGFYFLRVVGGGVYLSREWRWRIVMVGFGVEGGM